MKGVILAVALLAAGCTSTLTKVDAVEKGIVEPKVDQLYDRAIKRWCAFPVDVQVRAMTRRTITIDTLFDACPDWRALRNAFRNAE